MRFPKISYKSRKNPVTSICALVVSFFCLTVLIVESIFGFIYTLLLLILVPIVILLSFRYMYEKLGNVAMVTFLDQHRNNVKFLSFFDRIERIEKNLSKDMNEIINWLNNFLRGETDFALILLENFRYIDKKQFYEVCTNAYRNLLEKILTDSSYLKIHDDLLFFNFGEEAKSNKLVSYHFRLANKIPERIFINIFDPLLDFVKGRILIYIDDISVSGNQFLEDWKTFIERIKIKWPQNYDIFLNSNKFIFLPIFISKRAKKRIEKKTIFHVVNLPRNVITKTFMTFKKESKIFQKAEINKAIEVFCKYGKELYPKGPLGYGNHSLLMSFFFNTPNNTLPVIWQKSPSEFCNSPLKWDPIFPRFESRK